MLPEEIVPAARPGRLRQLWLDFQKPADEAPLHLVALAGLIPGLGLRRSGISGFGAEGDSHLTTDLRRFS